MSETPPRTPPADLRPEPGEYRVGRLAPYRGDMYRVEVAWMDAGGMEHGMKSWAIDRAGVEQFVADTLDVVEELQRIIDEADRLASE